MVADVQWQGHELVTPPQPASDQCWHNELRYLGSKAYFNASAVTCHHIAAGTHNPNQR
jgi:hypothetical protein